MDSRRPTVTRTPPETGVFLAQPPVTIASRDFALKCPREWSGRGGGGSCDNCVAVWRLGALGVDPRCRRSTVGDWDPHFPPVPPLYTYNLILTPSVFIIRVMLIFFL